MSGLVWQIADPQYIREICYSFYNNVMLNNIFSANMNNVEKPPYLFFSYFNFFKFLSVVALRKSYNWSN